MGAELDKMHTMLQNVSSSMESRDLEIKEFEAQIKAFDAETKRLTAVQASMSPDQIQQIVLGTVHGMLDSGDLAAGYQEVENADITEQAEAPQVPGMPAGMPQGVPQ
jgi:hypothetical protein